ncbi:MAG: SEC-C domain-containing protein [Actinomycetia bacterium]|nr:SEC-C domain-containing protein [Actinomycetes bacterium]
MQPIGRNDPCPCGSGKKYKKCCQLKDDVVDLETFRYEKYLSVRSSAADNMIKIADKKVGVNPIDVIAFLTDSPIYNKINIDLFSYSEDEALLFQYILNSSLMYAYPIGNLNDLLWKHCLNEYKNKFDLEEVLFLQSLENFTAGFFQAKDVEDKKYLVTAEDMFTANTYKIMDKGLSTGIVKNDIFCGMLIPYNKDIYIVEGGTPIIFPPLEKGYIKETVDILYMLNKKKLPGDKNERLSKFLNLYPINIYRVALDYHYLTMETPPPKLMTTDNEELIFSKTFYKLSDMPEVKNRLLKIEDFRISEENEKEVIISWNNKKDTILGTIFLTNKELRFETNSKERLEKWKSKVKVIPIKFVKTEYIDYQSLIKEISETPLSDNKDLKEEKIYDIPEEELRDFALDYWNKYYDGWINGRIPFLDNKTPLEAIKTEEGKQKVIDLIDDYENKNLHMMKNYGGGNNVQKFFNVDELRKRLNL